MSPEDMDRLEELFPRIDELTRRINGMSVHDPGGETEAWRDAVDARGALYRELYSIAELKVAKLAREAVRLRRELRAAENALADYLQESKTAATLEKVLGAWRKYMSRKITKDKDGYCGWPLNVFLDELEDVLGDPEGGDR